MGKLDKLLISKGDAIPNEISIVLPRSKSISNRLLVMRALSGNAITIQNLSKADDTTFLNDFLNTDSEDKWVGEAGTALRFGLAWAAITPGKHIIKGSDRINQRPISGLVNALRLLGAEIDYLETEGRAPLAVNGKKLAGGSIEIEGHLSSQYVSALLLIAPCLGNGISIKLMKNQVSRPYIDMTLALMKRAGIQISIHTETIRIEPGKYKSTTFDVEPDWSAASYFYAFKYLNPNLNIEIEGLQNQSIQGDFETVKLAQKMGLQSIFDNKNLRFESIEADLPRQMSFHETPDLAQTFAAMAAGKQLPLKLRGLQTLRVKETDRIAALVTELGKCGIVCKSNLDSLEIVDFEHISQAPEIETYEDHRMAMAFAPLVSIVGEIIIGNPEVVSKSFPDYWNQVEKMGFKITKIYT